MGWREQIEQIKEFRLSQEELIRRGDLSGDATKAQKAARKRQFQINRSNEENKLRGLADQTMDMSFLTPEYTAAQDRVTIDPIRREFATQRQQGFNQSLRSGAPVGAFLNANAGAAGQALGDQSSRNFLANTQTGMDVAGRRFGQNFDTTGFYENRRKFDEELQQRRREARGASRAQLIGGAAQLGGFALGGGFGGGGGGGAARGINNDNSLRYSAANQRRFSL